MSATAPRIIVTVFLAVAVLMLGIAAASAISTGRALSREKSAPGQVVDIPRYEKLFGRAVEVVNMGNRGHTAVLFNLDKYVELLQQALR